MIRQWVASSDLKSVGYEATSALLEIEFRSGGIYQYDGVPMDIYQGLMTAPSHGSFFHAYIKGRFPYRRIA